MSKPIRYDSLLVRDLAAELNTALAGEPLHAVRFDRDARLLELEATHGWRWMLHPTRGTLVRVPRSRLDGNVLLPRRARIERVAAAPDERILELVVSGDDDGTHGGVARRLVVELLTNQWNAIALAAEDRITHVLHPRTTGARRLQTGDVYQPPEPTGRLGVAAPLDLDGWRSVVGAAAAGQRVRAFLSGVAWASPLNAHHVIGSAEAQDRAVDDAWRRYVALVAGPRDPCLLPAPDAQQPYGVPLGGDPRRFGSLLDAFEAAAGPRTPDAPADGRDAALAQAALQAEQAAVKARRLRAQLAQAPAQAAILRQHADLLLAQLHRVPKGASHATLDDFAGGSVEVALDPTLTPAENAAQQYGQARKRERAAARLPALIERAEAQAARWRALHARIEAGEVTDAEIAALPAAAPRRGRRGQQDAALPYRVYRTTGGLEVRVGRSPKANDALTLRHSHGNDVWLHARDVGGAHVVLRWSEREANPPHRDLEEAAALAALHSRARTSKLVPVDYTRRKYVRKPRRSPPGRVVFERGKTIFVEPDPEMEERLREVEES